MSVEISYRIIQMGRISNSVKMILEEVRLISPEEIARARLEAEKEPETDINEEGEQLQKVAFAPEPTDPTERMFWAMRKQFPEMVEMLKSAPTPIKMLSAIGPKPISRLVEMLFTREQYVELGSPPLLSVLKVSIKVET